VVLEGARGKRCQAPSARLSRRILSWRGEAVFELPGGGRYGITVTRPRAPDFGREFVVNDGEQRHETMTLEGSPHEYPGWQPFAASKPRAFLRGVAFESSPPPPQLFSTALPKGRDTWDLTLSADSLVRV
jgi:hypothetical protein